MPAVPALRHSKRLGLRAQAQGPATTPIAPYHPLSTTRATPKGTRKIRSAPTRRNKKKKTLDLEEIDIISDSDDPPTVEVLAFIHPNNLLLT